MTFLLAVLAGILGTALGYGAGLLAGTVLVDLLHISSREGGAGMFVAFVTGPIGALVGLVLAVVLVVKLRDGGDALAVAGRSLLVVVALLGAVPVAIWVYPLVVPSEYLQSNGPNPLLEMEVRLPGGAFVPADSKLVRLQLVEKVSRDAEFGSDWRRQEEGRIVLAGQAMMFFRTSTRFVVLGLPGEPDRLWRLSLPGDPRSKTEWSAWRPVDEVFEKDAQTGRKPRPEEQAEARVRVFPR